MAYYVKKAAEQNLIALSMCQSDPMSVPFGGTENFFGTNPIAFAAPREDRPPIVFDMATTVQAWGKILDARAKNKKIPSTWAVDASGSPTDDPYAVKGLLPIAGVKGHGLMMMVDILAGSLMGLPFGPHVTSMYDDLTQKRRLGQMFLLIDPKRFTDIQLFKKQMSQMVSELHQIQPTKNNEKVYYPGETTEIAYQLARKNGVEIPQAILDYLKSDVTHFDQYSGKGAFAE